MVGQTGLSASSAVFLKKLKIVSTAVKHFADRSRMVFVSCLLHRSEAVLAETTMWGAQFWWPKFAKSILPAGRSPSSLFTRKVTEGREASWVKQEVPFQQAVFCGFAQLVIVAFCCPFAPLNASVSVFKCRVQPVTGILQHTTQAFLQKHVP